MSGRVVVGILTDIANWHCDGISNLILAILVILFTTSTVQTPQWVSPKQHFIKYGKLLIEQPF